MHQICRCIQGCKEDNGNILGLVVFLQDNSGIEATDVGHHHIEEYQIRMFLLGHLDTTCTIVGRTHLKLLVGQEYLQQQDIADDVINNQYLILTSVYLRL